MDDKHTENKQTLKQRIASAQSRHNEQLGGDQDDQGNTAVDGKALGEAMRVGIELVSAVAVGSFIGYWIDKWLDTGPFGMIIFFFFGFAAGFVNLYKAQTKNYHKTGFQQLTEDQKNGQKGSENSKDKNNKRG